MTRRVPGASFQHSAPTAQQDLAMAGPGKKRGLEDLGSRPDFNMFLLMFHEIYDYRHYNMLFF